MNLLKKFQKSNPDKVYKEMFREAVMTVKNFNHRPSVSYFFEAVFPELLNADFYGKENFEKKSQTLESKIEMVCETSLPMEKHTKSRGETHPSISSSSALSMLYVFEALFHRLFLLQQ